MSAMPPRPLRYNVVQWAKYGVEARWVPIGYANVLTSPKASGLLEEEKPFDVGFFGMCTRAGLGSASSETLLRGAVLCCASGTLNAERRATLQQVLDAGINITLLGGYYHELFPAVRDTKIVLNLQSFYLPGEFKMTRLQLLLANEV